MKTYLSLMEGIIGTAAALSFCAGGLMADSEGAAFDIALRLLLAGVVAMAGVLICEGLKYLKA